MPYIELTDKIGEGFFSQKSTGENYGVSPHTRASTTDVRVEAQRLKHLYMLYIYMENDEIHVRKFVERNCSHKFSATERNLLKKSQDMRVDPNWPDVNLGNDLYSFDFSGAGKWVIVLGNPRWRFYDYNTAGHTAVNFLEKKTLYRNGAYESLNGSKNSGILNGTVGDISGFPAYRCDNFLLDEAGNHLGNGISQNILFDINIEIPVVGGTKALIVIDPGGRNTGP